MPPTRQIKIVSIIDEHIRECLGLAERSITADVLIDELDRLATRRTLFSRLRSRCAWCRAVSTAPP